MKKSSLPIIDMRAAAGRAKFERILRARKNRDEQTERRVAEVIEGVRTQGDGSLFEFTKRFDGVELDARSVRLDPAQIDDCARSAPAELKRTIREAAKRIRAYHQQQTLPPFTIQTPEGRLSQIVKPLQRVGIYVPGGFTVYPSSVLMNAIPAQIAGVQTIVAVTPPRWELRPALAYVFKYLGIGQVYRIGGAQAVAALAYGTKSIPAVDKIVGPGSSYVALAKKMVYGAVDIDMVAGPSEVAIVADESAPPRWVALDLLSQAEHGSGDEMAVLVTESEQLAREVQQQLLVESRISPVAQVFENLGDNAICLCVTQSRAQSMELINHIAPEHLQLMTSSPRRDLRAVDNAGAVFLGSHTPVPMGDYFVGTNHVLPTGGAARFASPLGVTDFLKRISVAEVRPGRSYAPAADHVARFARAESFEHHARSVECRLQKNLPPA